MDTGALLMKFTFAAFLALLGAGLNAQTNPIKTINIDIFGDAFKPHPVTVSFPFTNFEGRLVYAVQESNQYSKAGRMWLEIFLKPGEQFSPELEEKIRSYMTSRVLFLTSENKRVWFGSTGGYSILYLGGTPLFEFVAYSSNGALSYRMTFSHNAVHMVDKGIGTELIGTEFYVTGFVAPTPKNVFAAAK
jgi:hypothetical protein